MIIFLKQWFSGVDDFLENSADEKAGEFLSCCAVRCSDSYPVTLYEQAFKETDNVEDLLKFLASNFSGFNYILFPDKIQLTYKECGCDLFKEKLITSKKLCICSEKSLYYIWGKLYEPENVNITRKASIINGDDSCIFEIRLKQMGHFN